MDYKEQKPTEGQAPVDHTFEAMFKKWKNDVMHLGLLEELRERRYYTKPSEKRRAAEKKAKRK